MRLVIRRKVRTDHGPALPFISRDMHILAADIHLLVIVTGDRHGIVPVPAVFHLRRWITITGFGPCPHIANTAGTQIGTVKTTIITTRPDEPIVLRIRLRKSPLTTADGGREPKRDTALQTITGTAVRTPIRFVPVHLI